MTRRRTKPQAVYPSGGLFRPAPEVLELGEAIIRFLLGEGIGVAFLTKGYIPDHVLGLLSDHAEPVGAQIGIITLDEGIARTFGSSLPASVLSIDMPLIRVRRFPSFCDDALSVRLLRTGALTPAAQDECGSSEVAHSQAKQQRDPGGTSLRGRIAGVRGGMRACRCGRRRRVRRCTRRL